MKYTHLTISYNIFTFATAKLFLGMKSTKRITFFHLSTLWFKQIVIVCDLIELYSTLRTFFLSRGEEIWKVIVRFRKKKRQAHSYIPIGTNSVLKRHWWNLEARHRCDRRDGRVRKWNSIVKSRRKSSVVNYADRFFRESP